MTPKPPSTTTAASAAASAPDFVMPTGKPTRAPRRAPATEPEGLLLAPPDTSTSLTPTAPDAPATVPQPVPVPVPSFSDWIASPVGRDCADPRFLPQEPSRRQAELERRLKLAWDAARTEVARTEVSREGGAD